MDRDGRLFDSSRPQGGRSVRGGQVGQDAIGGGIARGTLPAL